MVEWKPIAKWRVVFCVCVFCCFFCCMSWTINFFPYKILSIHLHVIYQCRLSKVFFLHLLMPSAHPLLFPPFFVVVILSTKIVVVLCSSRIDKNRRRWTGYTHTQKTCQVNRIVFMLIIIQLAYTKKIPWKPNVFFSSFNFRLLLQGSDRMV